MDFKALRKEYEQEGIDENGLPAEPMPLFENWFLVATEKCPGDWFEPNAMSLASSDGQGNVTVRIVLLKHITKSGIQFFTNYRSTKGQQLAVNPRAAVVFHWPYLGRQIRLEGSVAKTAREVSEKYFHTRPRGSQIGAAISQQSEPLTSRDELERLANDLDRKFANGEIPLPSDWGGYELTVDKAEFWQGRSDRMHDRIAFRLDGTGQGWQRGRLSP